MVKKIISFCIIILIASAVIFFIAKKISVINLKIEALNEPLISGELLSVLDDYFLESGTYPMEISDLWSKNADRDFFKSLLTDPFCDDSSQLLYYIPFLDSKTNSVYSFAFISCGPDGQLNQNTPIDIYTLDYLNNASLFYNDFNLADQFYNPSEPKRFEYSMFLYLIHPRDILLCYFDKLRYRNNISKFLLVEKGYNIDSVLYRIIDFGYSERKKQKTGDGTIKQEISIPLSINYEIARDSIFFQYKGYQFKCAFNNNKNTNALDNLIVSGILSNVNIERKTITLSSCTIIAATELN